MHITGHKIIKEPVQIKVDNTEIWNLVADTCFPSTDYVDASGKYFQYSYTHPHCGDDQYDTRPATQQEIDVYNALQILSPIFFEKSKGK